MNQHHRDEPPTFEPGGSGGSNPLQQSVEVVPGIGQRLADQLQRLGIRTVHDLLLFVPKDVVDLTHVANVADLKEGELQSVCGRVVDRDSRLTGAGRRMTGVVLDTGTGFVRGVWFNQAWVLQRFAPNARVMFTGQPKFRQQRWEFTHPTIQWLDDDEFEPGSNAVLPRYRLTEGLRMVEMRRVARRCCELFSHLVPDPIPTALRDEWKIPAMTTALNGLHNPQSLDEFTNGRRRLVFEDLLEFQIGMQLRRRSWRQLSHGLVIECPKKVDARIRRLLPFQLTAGQEQAIREICGDLQSGVAMHRLLQADVGAGKTVVAIYAMLVAVAAGYQAVLMAPTELLSNQHAATVQRLLEHSRVVRVLLTGQLKSEQRRTALEQIRSGAANLIVGTQAVIQHDVRFAKLGLVVIDEQHKFGVLQRAKFGSDNLSDDLTQDFSANNSGTAAGDIPPEPMSADKSRRSPLPATSARPTSAQQPAAQPHTLVMTATPIPRSLCLTQFGDLDLTVMNELPPGRIPVVTNRITTPAAASKMWSFLCEKLRQGRQLYVVCPRVGEDSQNGQSGEKQNLNEQTPNELTPNEQTFDEPSAGDDATTAVATFERLHARELQGFQVGLLHGRLPTPRKDAVMDAFRNGSIQALVATSVVEVGVDVPNATLMVVFDAERFGLSQLHQLRGRVGRGQFQGYCFLCSRSDDPAAVDRLAAVEKAQSGFEVAEADFRMRGPGDVLGTQQSGNLPLRFANLVDDAPVLDETRAAAVDVVTTGRIDSAEYLPLKLRVMERFGQMFDIAGSG